MMGKEKTLFAPTPSIALGTTPRLSIVRFLAVQSQGEPGDLGLEPVRAVGVPLLLGVEARLDLPHRALQLLHLRIK